MRFAGHRPRLPQQGVIDPAARPQAGIPTSKRAPLEQGRLAHAGNPPPV